MLVRRSADRKARWHVRNTFVGRDPQVTTRREIHCSDHRAIAAVAMSIRTRRVGVGDGPRLVDTKQGRRPPSVGSACKTRQPCCSFRPCASAGNSRRVGHGCLRLAEARVALSASSRASISETAHRLNISPNTVKTLLRLYSPRQVRAGRPSSLDWLHRLDCSATAGWSATPCVSICVVSEGLRGCRLDT